MVGFNPMPLHSLCQPPPSMTFVPSPSTHPDLNHSLHNLPSPDKTGLFRWLVEERDACGVGFLADLNGSSSHELVRDSLAALRCLEHRGGCSADFDSGDGAGIMTGIPWLLFREWTTTQGLPHLHQATTGVGMVFLPPDPTDAARARELIEGVFIAEGLTTLGWRVVPCHSESLGAQAGQNKPQIEQVLVRAMVEGDALERLLYLVRKRIHQTAGDLTHCSGWAQNLYICSLSNRTIVYKGMVRSAVLSEFYTDLQSPAYTSPFAIFHRRFSTNTLPKWSLAQPMRLLSHNGEINTLLGNVNWMVARQADLRHEFWGDRIQDLLPIVNRNNSDSANLDNVFELFVRSGRSPQEALMIMVPEAYQNQPDMAAYPEITSFYEYYSPIQEPWDGPALLVYSDGHSIGATLDRNGLRPARYAITKKGWIVVASECGVVELDEREIIEKGRLGPGQMISVSLETGTLLKNWEIKQRVASSHPFGKWLGQYRQHLTPCPYLETPLYQPADLLRNQTAFGYTSEDVEMIIEEMAGQGKEPTFCMGDDTPLAVLSRKPHILYNYFKQRFAQVTNPAIDPLRENLVMSLSQHLGVRGNLLTTEPRFAQMLTLDSPVLNEAELTSIQQGSGGDFLQVRVLSTLVSISSGPHGLETEVQRLCNHAATAIQEGVSVLVLSDRPLPTSDHGIGLSESHTYIPPLLAVGAVHHFLIRLGLRMQVSLVVDTGQCWSTHHFACLIGYGASAVCPYLALESVRHWWSDPKTQTLMERGKISKISVTTAQGNYRKAVESGLLKILSKMGISLLSSYQGSQIFEAIGLGPDLIQLGFSGTASRIGGLTIAELAEEVMVFHGRAFPELTSKKLENYGFVQYRPSGEYHMNSPEMAKLLHKALAAHHSPSTQEEPDSPTPGYDHYQLYRQLLADRPPTALRDLLEFHSDRPPIPIDEVESPWEIVKRFCTGGMSLGALSRDAHETLAIAMNRLGGKSNSGEGGEDPVRFSLLHDVDSSGHSSQLPHLHGLRLGDTANSAIKQVASGRFGVTPAYLTNAQQLEIKVSQGAKPGEGGQLPGQKVSPYIAYLRRSKPGVSLISPPPHHDIYSIEDLAQLIFDLHQINPNARVSVKLVAEIGIGTVAVGVAKANADIIQISGHDGGTGASPLSSIKHAGSPWELGLTEVHRALMENQLRDRVLVRVDGGFKTGWDVVMGALMGAEEFGFGSIAMIAEGCIMARICHTNNCPVGVATQRDELRKRFPGTPGHVVQFFLFIAEEVRALLAHLGYHSLEDIVGRADLLVVRHGEPLTKTKSLHLDCLTQLPDTSHDRSWLSHGDVHGNGFVLDDQILAHPEVQLAITQQGTVRQSINLVNTDRTVGARIAGAIAQVYGDSGFAGQLQLQFHGSAGQSFGAFNLPGMILTLEGEANDYVGKGMHGGEIIVKPPTVATYNPADNVIIGNTCLYGATGGTLFANGQAGERFAVRNSQAHAVIEGAGDHCCEYMTGGVVVVLGRVGRNVGAGMTGGLAYFLDEDGIFVSKVNREIVTVQRVITPVGEQQLFGLITAHGERTGSPKAMTILRNWADYLPKFWQLVPPSEADSPEANRQTRVTSII